MIFFYRGPVVELEKKAGGAKEHKKLEQWKKN
jgi:hypothetical protein